MTRTGMALLAAAGLAFAGTAAAQAVAPEWHVLQTGTTHGGEAPLQPGAGWFALKVVGGKWHLVAAKVTGTAVPDPVVGDAADRSGIRIDSDVSDALALLRAPGLAPGKVDTPDMRFKDQFHGLGPRDGTLTVNFKGHAYRFVAHGLALDLELDRRSTHLIDRMAIGADASAYLVWAGDLDGDGALDFLLGTSTSNSGSLCLYLSRGAPAGQLVQGIGCQDGTGC